MALSSLLVVAAKRRKTPKHKGPFSIDYEEWRSHARGVYPTQDTSRMGTAKVKQEEEAVTRIIVK